MKDFTVATTAKAGSGTLVRRYPSLPYVIPFAVFLLFMAAREYLAYEFPIRVLRLVAVAALLMTVSRKAISLRVARPLMSILAGAAVFAVWIGPDLIWPTYRSHWLSHNALFGGAQASMAEGLRTDAAFLFVRILTTALLVPIVEELFWRAWLMRYLISSSFQSVALGAFSALSFWATAVLFASEHGPYWDVGLLAGIAYNWWMIRTRSLGDCILAHAVTNACLAAYVLTFNQWQYWL